MTSRRQFLCKLGIGATPAIAAAAAWIAPAAARAAKDYPVMRTDPEWRARLDPQRYAVLRRAGTERPHSSPLNHEKRTGVFACAGCDHPLFSSATKFESGTGWPSFWQALPGAVTKSADQSFGMSRDEVLCARCGSHLGHVFDDGPPPTRLRYCMNGLALAFAPKDRS